MSDGRVLVVLCHLYNAVHIHSADRQDVRIVELNNSLSNLRHAVENSAGNLIICSGEEYHRHCELVEVTINGTVVGFYEKDLRSSSRARDLKEPTHLAIDADGNLYVADCSDNTINIVMILDPNFRLLGIILHTRNKERIDGHHLNCLCYSAATKQLIVGLDRGEGNGSRIDVYSVGQQATT